MRYLILVVWNREFDWSIYRSANTEVEALKIAEDILDSGDGERVKKVRVFDQETGKIIQS